MNSSHAPIIRRRVNIDFADAKVDRWSHDSKEFENALNAMSFFFPTGETYFVDSVRAYLDKITDPELKQQARNFIYQEAMHTKEHARSNEELKKVHPYGEMMERLAKASMAPSRKFMPKSTQLATTCAMEHFTAMFANSILTEQDHVMEANDPAFAALWLWHAVEETEHKGVCFDVYQHVVGKGPIAYLHRVAVMASVTLLGIAGLSIGFGMIKWQQRKLKKAAGPDAEAATDGAPALSVLAKFAPLGLYLDYYRPSFHPWNHDNSDLIAKWKAAYGDHPGIRESGSNETVADSAQVARAS